MSESMENNTTEKSNSSMDISDQNQQNAPDESIAPPEHDSPKNITNILNNKCLQTILRNMETVRDFLAFAEVCIRFQENAIVCFPFKKIQLGYEFNKDDENYKQLRYNPNGNINCRRLLSIFASRIKSIKCAPKRFDDPTMAHASRDENLRLISVYCGQTINELEINANDFVVQAPCFLNFEVFPKLKCLRLCGINGHTNWLENEFPKLEYIEFNKTKVPNEVFVEFQNRNIQLKGFSLSYMHLNSIVLENIETRLPNLVNIFLLRVGNLSENIIYLKKLPRLKRLYLCHFSDLNPIKSLVSSFTQNNQPIEELLLNYVDIELGRMLHQLGSLKRLYLHDIIEEVLFEISQSLGSLNLELLEVGLRDSIKTDLKVVTIILKHCNQITELNFYCNEIKLENYYLEIVKLATGHIKVNIFYSSKNNTFTIKGNNEWVRESNRFPSSAYANILKRLRTY